MGDINNTLAKIYSNSLTGKEIIRRITKVYHAGYDLNNLTFDIYDQLLACEAIDEAEREYKERNNNNSSGNVSVTGNVSGSYKLEVKSELNWYKSELIYKLKLCTSETPQNEIAMLLEEVFKPWPNNKERHWLWISQTYTARTLIWVMSATIKKYLRGGIRKTPPAYFTYLLGFRKKRKEFRNTNDTR